MVSDFLRITFLNRLPLLIPYFPSKVGGVAMRWGPAGSAVGVPFSLLAAHSVDLSAKIVKGWTVDTAEFRWGDLGLTSFSESRPCDQHGVKGFPGLCTRSISSTVT